MPDVTPNTEQQTAAPTETVAAPAPQDAAQTPAAAPAAAVPAAAAPTAAPEAAKEPAKPEAKSYWPEDWREKWASGDEKKMARISKYLSPENVMDALVAAQNKIATGQYKQPPSKDAPAEELAEWRKLNNVPESPEKYDLNFQNGLVIGEEDKPIIDEFLKAAHETNLNNDAVKRIVNWYYDEQDRQHQKVAERDKRDMETASDTLHSEWGNSYRTYTNEIENFLAANFQADDVEALRHARLADGTALWNNVNIVKAFAQLAHNVNPSMTLVPSGDTNPMGTITDEIAKIEKFMRSNRTEYNKDQAMQTRLMKLYEAQNKLKSRSAA